MQNNIALAFDTETTGLISNRTVPLDKQPEIIEFYGCLFNLETGEVLKEFECLIKPTNPVDDEITSITGITNEMLKDCKSFKDYAPILKTLLQNAPLLIAHNLSFDQEMLEIEFERLGEKINFGKRLCTVEATAYLKGFRFKLSDLYEYLFGERFIGAHRAKHDVMALVKCCCELRKRGVI
jgi:DNA polymerase III epsilon subunit family exonuclease